MTELAVVGSARWSPEGEMAVRCIIIPRVFDLYRPALVISGGCVGVDTWAADEAMARGIPVVEYLPRVRNWAMGFKPRNMHIAESCDALVRIATWDSKTYGSGWTRDCARRLGKPTWGLVWHPKGLKEER